MAKKIIGANMVAFTSVDDGVPNTRAYVANPAGVAADVSFILNHGLNAYLPTHASWTKEHNLEVCGISVQDMYITGTGNLGTLIESLDANNILITFEKFYANATFAGLIQCNHNHSFTR